MIIQGVDLAVPLSTTAGASQDCNAWENKDVFFGGDFTGTLQIEISPDGLDVLDADSRWYPVGAAVPGTPGTPLNVIHSTSVKGRKIRANVTAYTSNTTPPTVTVRGLYSTRGG